MSGVKAREAQQKTETPRVRASLPVALSLFWHHGAEADARKMALKERDGRKRENFLVRAWNAMDGLSNKAVGKAVDSVANNAVESGIIGGGLFSMGITTLMLYNGLLATAASDGSLMMASGVGAAGLLVMGTGLALIFLSGYYIFSRLEKKSG